MVSRVLTATSENSESLIWEFTSITSISFLSLDFNSDIKIRFVAGSYRDAPSESASENPFNGITTFVGPVAMFNLSEMVSLEAGDIIMTMGAGDIYKVADSLVEK